MINRLLDKIYGKWGANGVTFTVIVVCLILAIPLDILGPKIPFIGYESANFVGELLINNVAGAFVLVVMNFVILAYGFWKDPVYGSSDKKKFVNPRWARILLLSIYGMSFAAAMAVTGPILYRIVGALLGAAELSIYWVFALAVAETVSSG